MQYPLLFPYGQGGRNCGIKKIKCSSITSTQIYCEKEQLPSIKNMCSIDKLRNMEVEVMLKEKHKRDSISCLEYY